MSTPKKSPIVGHKYQKDELTGEVIETPIVEVTVSISWDKKGRLFTFWCPWCRKNHIHGGGYVDEPIEDYLGHRSSHCTGDVKSPLKTHGYILKLPEDYDES
jgi:hypothetical protein